MRYRMVITIRERYVLLQTFMLAPFGTPVLLASTKSQSKQRILRYVAHKPKNDEFMLIDERQASSEWCRQHAGKERLHWILEPMCMCKDWAAGCKYLEATL